MRSDSENISDHHPTRRLFSELKPARFKLVGTKLIYEISSSCASNGGMIRSTSIKDNLLRFSCLDDVEMTLGITISKQCEMPELATRTNPEVRFSFRGRRVQLQYSVHLQGSISNKRYQVIIAGFT